jgi:hypothetical protein
VPALARFLAAPFFAAAFFGLLAAFFFDATADRADADFFFLAGRLLALVFLAICVVNYGG